MNETPLHDAPELGALFPRSSSGLDESRPAFTASLLEYFPQKQFLYFLGQAELSADILFVFIHLLYRLFLLSTIFLSTLMLYLRYTFPLFLLYTFCWFLLFVLYRLLLFTIVQFLLFAVRLLLLFTIVLLLFGMCLSLSTLFYLLLLPSA